MINRQQEEQVGPAQSGPGQRIAAAIQLRIAATGDFEIRNARAYFQQGGQEVTDLQPGQGFEIHCDYEIRNTAAGITWWSTCMTVYNTTDGIAEGADEYGNHQGSGWKDAHDAINMSGIQSSKNYRVTIFANQAANAGQPPTSEW